MGGQSTRNINIDLRLKPQKKVAERRETRWQYKKKGDEMGRPKDREPAKPKHRLKRVLYRGTGPSRSRQLKDKMLKQFWQGGSTYVRRRTKPIRKHSKTQRTKKTERENKSLNSVRRGALQNGHLLGGLAFHISTRRHGKTLPE